MKTQPFHTLLRRLALLPLLLLPILAQAQVELPNGTVNAPVVDMKVKVLGGVVTVDRQWWDGNWRLNIRWNAAELSGAAWSPGEGCLAYPEVKVQGRTYNGSDGQTWLLENRYSVRAIEHFAGSECLPNRTSKLRWQDRTSGNWMEYERVDAGTLAFRLAKYGDRNNISVSLHYNATGQLSEVRDHHGNPVLKYRYTGTQLSEIQDVPNTNDNSPARSVKYTWGSTTYKGQSQPVITAVTNVLGNTTNYTIQNGYLTRITDAEGRERNYTYTADRITQYADGEGNKTTYVYDYDKLKREFYVRVTDPLGIKTENWYDVDGYLIRKDIDGKTQTKRTSVDTVARSTTTVDAAGRQTVITRDEFGNLVKTQYPDGSAVSAKYSTQHGRVTEETDELGVKTSYEYDAKGNLTKKTEAVGQPEQRITEYTVDTYGQTLSITRRGGTITLPNGQSVTQSDATTTYEYDAFGNRIADTNPLGKRSRIAYNRSGQILQRTDATNQIWTRTYDAAGNLLSEKNPLGDETKYRYDKSGNRIESVDPLGKIWSSAYDQNDGQKSVTNPFGQTSSRSYDAKGRLVSETDAVGALNYQLVYNAQGRISEAIDAAGNRSKTIWDDSVEPNGSIREERQGLVRTYTYDSRGRVIERKDSANTLVGGGNQSVAYSSKNIWDAKGQQTEVTDKNGNKSQISYDKLGRIIQVTDVLGGATRFAWDTADNLLAVTDAKGSTTRYEYDAAGRQTKEIRPFGQPLSYQYDDLGQLNQMTDPKGNKITFQYDNARRGISASYTAAGAASPNRTITYSRNAAGHITGYIDQNTGHAENITHSAQYTLDALGRRTQETITLGNQTYTLATTYDAAGNKSSQTWPDGQTLTYTYSAGNLQNIAYPEGGQLSITARWWNLPQNILFPGGTTQTQTWDGFGRLIGQQVKSPGQAELMKRITQYDPEHNPIKIDSEQGNKQYTYDALYRLTQADNPSGLPNERYTLDAVGNRLTDKNKPNPNQAEGQWQYNANHQLLQAATENTSFIGNNAQAINYTWDDAGNLIRKNTPAGTEAQNPFQNQRYQYDAQNRLIETKTPQGETIASYQYDPLGRRIRKTITREWDATGSTWQLLAEAKTSLYLYAEEGLMAEYRQSGANAPQLYATHGWEPNGMWGTSPIWTRTKRGDTGEVQRFHHHNDHLGTPQKSTDASGNIVWSQKATAFGETTVDPQSLIDNPHRFPGQYYDAETNTHYNYFRDYAPDTGRYRKFDPIGLRGGINGHIYVGGNPLGYADPYGLNPGTAVGGWIGTFVLPGPGTVVGAVIGTAIGVGIGWWIMESRSQGEGAEGRPADVNPGKDCDGKCKPCPPDPPPFTHPGDAHGSTGGFHTHQWRYHQAPDCTCRAGKESW